MPESESTDRRTIGTASLGVAIAVGAALLLLIGWIALDAARADRAWWAIPVDGPKFVAQWLADIRGGRLDAAYRATTPAYRARVSREAFGRWVADHPELANEPNPHGLSTAPRETSLTIGWNGIHFRSTPPRLTDRSDFLRPGRGIRTLATTVVSGDEGLRVDQAEFEPDGDPAPRP